MNRRTPPTSALVTGVAWLGALAVAGLLVLRRYEASLLPGNGYDLLHCFVPAAEAVAAGGDP